MRVLVLGGSGFIGRHVVAALLARGHGVVIGTRRPRRIRALPRIEIHLERLTQAADWGAALRGIDTVVNAVGILRERGRETYERVHHLGVAALAAACASQRVRLIHVSALGLHSKARSGFITSKLAGEHALGASAAEYCIVRPSLLDGKGGFGARWLRALALLPLHFVPVEATGRIAALDVGDLAEAIARLCERSGIPREVELGGSANRTLAEYLQALRASRGLPPAIQFRVPRWAARTLSHICDFTHFSPYSFGHLELLRRDNVPSPNRLAELLGRPPTAIGAAAASHAVSPA